MTGKNSKKTEATKQPQMTIATLNRLRGNEKRKVTIVSKHIDEFNSEDGDQSVLTSYFDRLQNVHSVYRDLVNQSLAIALEEQLNDLQTSFDEFEEQYYSVKDQLVKLMKDLGMFNPKLNKSVFEENKDDTDHNSSISNENDTVVEIHNQNLAPTSENQNVVNSGNPSKDSVSNEIQSMLPSTNVAHDRPVSDNNHYQFDRLGPNIAVHSNAMKLDLPNAQQQSNDIYRNVPFPNFNNEVQNHQFAGYPRNFQNPWNQRYPQYLLPSQPHQQGQQTFGQNSCQFPNYNNPYGVPYENQSPFVQNQYQSQETRIIGIKPPALQLPEFSGDHMQWVTFRDTFAAHIHNRTDMNDIVKFTYLIDKLKGEALDTIGNITMSSDGYQRAWNDLLERYNNIALIVDKHVDSLLNLPFSNRESATDLRKLLNECNSHVSSLSACNIAVDALSELMLINVIKKRMDTGTLREWEREVQINELPKWGKMIQFLKKRCYSLEQFEQSKKSQFNRNPVNISTPKQSFTKQIPAKPATSKVFVTSDKLFIKNSCFICNRGNHRTYDCVQFLRASVKERHNLISKSNACLNCLRKGHTVTTCYVKGHCRQCSGRHNSLLHYSNTKSDDKVSNIKKSFSNDKQSDSKINNQSVANTDNKNEASTSHSTTMTTQCQQPHAVTNKVLLSTAIINIADVKGCYHRCRVLLDSGSQSNFITEKFAKLLGIEMTQVDVPISCLNNSQTKVNYKMKTKIQSRTSNYAENLQFLVVPVITNSLPSTDINITKWCIPKELELADPEFNFSDVIDLLLGAEIFFKVLTHGKFQIRNKLPFMQETLFGWIFNGKYEEPIHSFVTSSIQQNGNDELKELMQKFWELESYPVKSFFSAEETACEEHFVQTHSRDTTGRYIVKLPFKDNYQELGESKSQAVRRFHYLEKRLNSNPELKHQYVNFIDEYLHLNHMKEIDDSVNSDESCKHANYYLPHHAVLKPSSSTTKLRVVFDGSAKSSTSLSLNDVLMVGANVQDNLFSIMLRFRKYKYVFTTDIMKMYRQVCVNDSDSKYQRILWRHNEDEPIKTYELTRVTYGTASAPFLATRSLNQLAIDESSHFPEASNVVLRDFYVDDVLTGSDSIEKTKHIQKQLVELLEKGGLSLHKWCSNNQEIIQNIPERNREIIKSGDLSQNESIKTLGLLWQPVQDAFLFNVQPCDLRETITKRTILSNVAKLYDPLGLLSPIVITAKLLIQQLWKSHADWDDKISTTEEEVWINFRQTLTLVNEIRLNRNVIPFQPIRIELHGFADASLQAYGSCVYLRCVSENQNISSMLLCSKSRVAPLKTISIARLELCAAVLLSNLILSVIKSLQIDFNSVSLWSDSEIVLAWINTQPYKLKTFVANRVNEIQENTVNFTWNHVPTNLNPADLISRGVMPNELQEKELWWNGPSFLCNPDHWPIQKTSYNRDDANYISEFKKEDIVVSIIVPPDKSVELRDTVNLKVVLPVNDIITHYGSMNKLQRITAYCLRFIGNCQTKYKDQRKKGQLTTDEMEIALKTIVRTVQKTEFKDDMKHLQKKTALPKSSRMRRLNPYIDDEGIIRVGGRLHNTDLDYDIKHQMLLPYSHQFTETLFRHEHVNNCHAGPSLLVSIIRQKFWPIDAKRLAYKVVHKCIACFITKPKIEQQIMGNLPKERASPSRPFSTTGIDFGGPFYVKEKYQKTTSARKVYLALFVCFATKAIHVEIVSDLTTESFIASLKRFISRRGKCLTIWSDNATNFVGANKELHRLYDFFCNEDSFVKINQFCTSEQIKWNFIPPRSPNFGGLWESSIKSVKTHLKKITTDVVFSYEELNTLFIQIEGILNSRPLYPLSEDPNDPLPLTPGHFLTGGPINALVEPTLEHIPNNHLSKWQRVTSMTQHFWKRFSVEYLHNLQQRNKWQKSGVNIKIRDVVLVIDEHISSTNWLMGVVTEVFCGSDGKIRVATIKTKKGEFRRAISKLCKFPIHDE